MRFARQGAWLLTIAVTMSAAVSAQDFAGRDKLRAHTNEFRKEVIKVTDGVYVAVGFSLGELTDYVLAVDEASVDARRLKGQALTEVGERQISANARNYYLSAAQFLLRGLPAQ